MPLRITSAGSWLCAIATRFWTSIASMFLSVPMSNVTVRLYEPSLPLFELMYSMSCEPLTCCSMEAATDCDTTSALAPGKLVVTVTCGGTTCGYCAIGRFTAASPPTKIMTSAMTVEKTGRSMKKLNMTRPWMIYSTCSASRIDGGNTPGSAFLLRCRRRRAGTGMAVDDCSHDRLHRRAGSNLADPLDHDSIAGVEATVDDPV